MCQHRPLLDDLLIAVTLLLDIGGVDTSVDFKLQKSSVILLKSSLVSLFNRKNTSTCRGNLQRQLASIFVTFYFKLRNKGMEKKTP